MDRNNPVRVISRDTRDILGEGPLWSPIHHTLDRVIPLPTSNITSVAFAGDGLDRMFVTSASLGCEGETHAGALFEVDAGVVGLPTPRFKG